MRIAEINTAYYDVFKKFLHVRLELIGGVDYTKDFKDEFEKRWKGKEIALSHLIGTVLDTDRWEFDEDLTIKMNSIPIFDQEDSVFLYEPIIMAEFESKIKHFALSTIMKLSKYMTKDKSDGFIDYITFLEHEKRY